MLAYIALGSNLDDPIRQVIKASQSIQNISKSSVACCSSFYQSPPMGPADQPDFINRVIAIHTDLTAEQLLDELQAIETRQGRVRTIHWGPRTIDLDILLYGNETILKPRLTIPHPGVKQRAFFVYPLCEITPNLILPTGESIIMLKEELAAMAIILKPIAVANS